MGLEMERLTRQELAERAGVEGSLIDHLVGLSILTPEEGEKPFTFGDLYRIRLILACERAGLKPDAVSQALDAGKVSLSFMDLPHYRFAALANKTYRQLANEMDLDIELALDVVQSMGYLRPSPDDRIREDDLHIFPILKAAGMFLDRDTLLRTARVYVDSLRRIVDAESTLFENSIVQNYERQGFDRRSATEFANQFGAQVSALQEEFIITAYRRQQEKRWTEYVVTGIEEVLEEMGLFERPARPPAFGFVDLAGYTRLTEERGDQAVAKLAADLAELVDVCAREHEGLPVKWLGDGVMVYYRDPGEAVEATLEVVKGAPEIGLPAHAGIAAGPVVFQDGDYYGRTVNMAARVAAYATTGQTLVTDEAAEIAAKRGLRFKELGPVELKGFSHKVRIFEALASD